MSADELRAAIVELRNEIRWHRDQRGDDRCWLDDDKLYKTLPEKTGAYTSAPPTGEFRRLCVEFFESRQRPDEPAAAEPEGEHGHRPAVGPTEHDGDLGAMNDEALAGELVRLQAGVRAHRDVARGARRWDHDRALYLLLSERTLVIWRLPSRERFIESCDLFNASCQREPTKLHAW